MSSDSTLALCIERFGEQYIQAYSPVEQVQRTLWRLRHCRTETMGQRLEKCQKCGYEQLTYKSCRDRHCPVCQGAKRLEWTALRKQELLPVTYFHVVFTLPACLNQTMLAFRSEAFASLFEAAWQTLNTFARNKGVQLGVSAVLHTWGSALTFHPHLHCIVTGGGADLKTGKWKNLPWVGRKKDRDEPFLFPVRALSKMFRAKFMESLSAKVHLTSPLREDCFAQQWRVYAKSPFCGPEKVLEYLARYAYRIAISNDRIVSVGPKTVTFKYKDYRNGGAIRTMTLDGIEFLRRYAIHILPKGLVRIRHYGILSPCNREKLASLQISLGVPPVPLKCAKVRAKEALAASDKGMKKCPRCGQWSIPHIRSPSAA